MATGSRTATWAISGNANWQAWCDAIYNTLIDAGWVQTSDTGQRAVPAADAYPVANTFTYWVFRLNDAAQATAPVYLKFEVAIGNSSTLARFQITVGTATNGAGTLNGLLLNAVSISTSGWGPSTTERTQFTACVAQGGAWFNVSEEIALFFYIGRSLDATGAPTSDAIIAAAQPATATTLNNISVWTKNARGYYATAAAMPGLYSCPAILAAGVRLGSAGLSPIYPIVMRTDAGKFQFGGAYGCSKTDFGAGSLQSINQFGTGAHSFVTPTSVSVNYPRGADLRQQALAGLMMIWE